MTSFVSTRFLSALPRPASSREAGFSLVELAVAITIIGLLLAGLIKGQEIVHNARASRLIGEIRAYENAFIDFQKLYGFLPGDIPNPADRLPNCTTAHCNTAGNGNNLIDGGSANMWFVANFSGGETKRTWLQLARAGLIDTINENYPLDYVATAIAGPGIDYPATPWSRAGYDVFFWQTGLGGVPFAYTSGHYIKTKTANMNQGIPSVIPSSVVASIDAKIDDGLPQTGKVVAWSYAPSITNCAQGSDNRYPVKGSTRQTCEAAFAMGF